jgi:hypothetical protein
MGALPEPAVFRTSVACVHLETEDSRSHCRHAGFELQLLAAEIRSADIRFNFPCACSAADELDCLLPKEWLCHCHVSDLCITIWEHHLWMNMLHDAKQHFSLSCR